jgi:HSP20 family protein
MSLVKWNPSRELLNIEKEFNRMVNALTGRFGFKKELDDELENASWMPLTDIIETKDNYIFKLDIPGVKKEDVKISFVNGTLSISGERKQEKESKDSKLHRIERTYGGYYRSFTLPQQIKEDKIEAEFKDGALTITVPKSEEAKPKEIEIKVN